MNSIKKIVLGTTFAAGATAMFVGTTNAHADEIYTIQSGDSLSKISQKFAGDNSLIKVIAEKNNIADINRIYVGEELTIPTSSDSSAKTEATPKVEAPATTETATQEYTYVAPVETVEVAPAAPAVATATTPSNTSSSKEWIANKESGGSYTATNGRYIGRYQLDASYLNGDYSAENQERVADQYVTSRYGSWDAAKAFWLANGWY
ncbi:LysM peptidoglycan-binding domain-containing protein [Enterococcus durans]|uniref:aggregation-promoting factor n=1 Tax=Enterococcus durans TaxID=53345 RepID=UPI0011BF6F8E|nr:LysM peptidoglycan-binding domain-containing protein [Enterococcus durans]NJE64130.1 LysM peptidoglycan-binding domain-containing protein [Enterococcus durans]QED58608.1 LysM peptidoglycan-binding domain-containing protein [Enterococcus durans]QED62063.1 LysM peptidoglycan-binding domain-containing protein [Enterococcus durans]